MELRPARSLSFWRRWRPSAGRRLRPPVARAPDRRHRGKRRARRLLGDSDTGRLVQIGPKGLPVRGRSRTQRCAAGRPWKPSQQERLTSDSGQVDVPRCALLRSRWRGPRGRLRWRGGTSTPVTCKPASASFPAASSPPGPIPITTTSVSALVMGFSSPIRAPRAQGQPDRGQHAGRTRRRRKCQPGDKTRPGSPARGHDGCRPRGCTPLGHVRRAATSRPMGLLALFIVWPGADG